MCDERSRAGVGLTATRLRFVLCRSPPQLFSAQSDAPWPPAIAADANTSLTMTHEERFTRLQLTLPAAPRPVAVYRPLVVAQGFAYVSGHGPLRRDR